MQKLQHIVLSVLVILISVLKFFRIYSKNKNILTFVIEVICFLLIINLLIWITHIVIDKVYKWYQKKKQKNYSLFTWLGDTDVFVSLYDELSNIKSFNQDNFHDNYITVKQKIKEHFTTINDLKAFRTYLEIKTDSSKYIAIFNSTQTIIIAVITTAIITLVNFVNTSSDTLLIILMVISVFWILLLNSINFMGREIDKMKVLLRLVNECIDEENKIIII